MSGSGPPEDQPRARESIMVDATIPTAAGGIDEKVSPQEQDAQRKAVGELQARETAGYGLGIAAIAGAVGLAIYSFCTLHSMAERFTAPIATPWRPGTPRAEAPWYALQVFYVSMATHAAITIALVWLIYQLLRAAERMLLPRYLATDAEIARTMLGISSPHREAARLTRILADFAAKKKD